MTTPSVIATNVFEILKGLNPQQLAVVFLLSGIMAIVHCTSLKMKNRDLELPSLTRLVMTFLICSLAALLLGIYIDCGDISFTDVPATSYYLAKSLWTGGIKLLEYLGYLITALILWLNRKTIWFWFIRFCKFWIVIDQCWRVVKDSFNTDVIVQQPKPNFSARVRKVQVEGKKSVKKLKSTGKIL